MISTNSKIGNCSMLGYVCVTALSSIVIHNANMQIPAMLSAFYTFLICIVFYSALSKPFFAKWNLIKEHGFEICMLNITTAICWIFTYLSLKFLPAGLYLFAYLCAMPISASILQRTKILKASLLSLGLMLLIANYHLPHLALGIWLAIIGGVSGTIYSIYSQRIMSYFSSSDILSLRFFLTVIICLVTCIYANNFQKMPHQFYLIFALMSFVSVILPLTFFQIGIKNLQLSKALSFLPLAPLLCYFLSCLFGYEQLHVLQLLSVFVISIILLV